MAPSLTDVVVVVPGIMGSVLHRHGKPVWDSSVGAVGHGVFSGLRSIRDLALPEGIGDEAPDDDVEAVGLIRGIRLSLGLWTFDVGYGSLFDRLRESFEVSDGTQGPANLVEFPYDWRLSNRHNGARLKLVAERALDEWRAQGGACADAELVFLCHSMGGLVARWYVDHLGGHDVTRKVITLGTPHRGALNALDQLVNGVRKGIGPFKADLTALGRSMPSLHQMLPEYACIEGPERLAKVGEVGLPGLASGMVDDAVRFHAELAAAREVSAQGYDLHPIVGFQQPTFTTARIEGGRAVGGLTIKGVDEGGDATVPRLSATPADLAPDHVSVHSVADRHGALPSNAGILDLIEGILTARSIVHRGGQEAISVDLDEVVEVGEPLVVRAVPVEREIPLEAVVSDLDGRRAGGPVRLHPDGTPVPLLGPGGYQVKIRGAGPRGALIAPVTSIVTVWPTDLPDP
ncbi:MAG TPA: hypothetical protein VF228_15915 [Iamia sp.]